MHMKKQQRGGTVVGFILGVIVGLGGALAVAVYVTKVPVPFLNKNGTRAPDQDAAEAKRAPRGGITRRGLFIGVGSTAALLLPPRRRPSLTSF